MSYGADLLLRATEGESEDPEEEEWQRLEMARRAEETKTMDGLTRLMLHLKVAVLPDTKECTDPKVSSLSLAPGVTAAAGPVAARRSASEPSALAVLDGSSTSAAMTRALDAIGNSCGTDTLGGSPPASTSGGTGGTVTPSTLGSSGSTDRAETRPSAAEAGPTVTTPESRAEASCKHPAIRGEGEPLYVAPLLCAAVPAVSDWASSSDTATVRLCSSDAAQHTLPATARTHGAGTAATLAGTLAGSLAGSLVGTLAGPTPTTPGTLLEVKRLAPVAGRSPRAPGEAKDRAAPDDGQDSEDEYAPTKDMTPTLRELVPPELWSFVPTIRLATRESRHQVAEEMARGTVGLSQYMGTPEYRNRLQRAQAVIAANRELSATLTRNKRIIDLLVRLPGAADPPASSDYVPRSLDTGHSSTLREEREPESPGSLRLPDGSEGLNPWDDPTALRVHAESVSGSTWTMRRRLTSRSQGSVNREALYSAVRRALFGRKVQLHTPRDRRLFCTHLVHAVADHLPKRRFYSYTLQHTVLGHGAARSHRASAVATARAVAEVAHDAKARAARGERGRGSRAARTFDGEPTSSCLAALRVPGTKKRPIAVDDSDQETENSGDEDPGYPGHGHRTPTAGGPTKRCRRRPLPHALFPWLTK